jgi:PAP2 superfamily
MLKQRSKRLKKVLSVYPKHTTMNLFSRILLLSVAGFFIATSAHPQMADFDYRILCKLESMRTPDKNNFFEFISKWNTPVCLSAPATLFIVGLAQHDKDLQKNSLYVTESIAVSSLFNVIIKKIFKRKRPYQYNPAFTCVVAAPNESFPSGHSAIAFSMATSMTLARPKWYVIAPAFGWATMIGYARMYLGVHYPTDVISAATMSSGISWLTYRLNYSFLKNK